jgi:gamma-glutamyl-gamma-aminobutyrate hydrolase PuuD
LLSDGREVNSYHGFAIDVPGDALEALAKSGDGTIEIMRHKKHKIYAQMYHPERYDPFHEYDLQFLQGYFNA